MTTCKDCGVDLSTDKCSYACHSDGLCFSCYFWREKVELAVTHPDRVVRVDGVHYFIGDENASKTFRGFAGHRFKIKFNDGREVTTTNLWCQGDIPENFQDRLPNNAQFLGS